MVGLREERSGGAETAKGGPWLCVVGWKRKRRWGTVWRLSGEAAVLGQSFVFKGGSGVRLLWEKRKNQKRLFCLLSAGRRTNEREGGAAGGTSRERRKKSGLGAGCAVAGEEKKIQGRGAAASSAGDEKMFSP